MRRWWVVVVVSLVARRGRAAEDAAYAPTVSMAPTASLLAEVEGALAAMARSESTLWQLTEKKQHYDAAWVLMALFEAGRAGALAEGVLREVLDKTRYRKSDFWNANAADDGSTNPLRFLRGTLDVVDGDDKVHGDLSGKSVGDHLSIVAPVLTPLLWSPAAFAIDRAKAVVLDFQLRRDETFGPAFNDGLGFVTRIPKDGGGYSFHRQVTRTRRQANSGGSTDKGGWNPDNGRDAHKVAWEDDVSMGAVVATALVEFHSGDLTDAERAYIGDTLFGVARGTHDLFATTLQHAYDLTAGEGSPVRWTRSIGWGAYGLALIGRSLTLLGRAAEAEAVAADLAEHLTAVVAWRDGATKLWSQVPNQSVEGNFLEVSGSALIYASMAELRRQCRLPAALEGAYADGIRALVGAVDQGTGHVASCSAGSSIGATPKYYVDRGTDPPDENSKAGPVFLALALAAHDVAHCASTTSYAPSPSPSKRTDACDDSESWHKKDDPAKDCRWVGALADVRCTVKGDGAVYAFEECLSACGVCGAACVDSPTWHKKDEPDKGCAWVKRILTRCAVVGEDSMLAFQACPVACATCDYAHQCAASRR